ncbi:type II secretion system protein GspM [Desulfuromonas thiophila]|uniref:MSHA biogenesis protein MshJ n=1 Tax=Desulfuromonas thiophila TaxID=57664 RepID=A0A1G6ZJP9_9BACT|nr:type II secretion system protein GspM [Desulfuromonas thiophila]SDE02879.1 MSHA biogenesis protein MshJ [Desulfuromonas thiophila]
MKWTAVGARLTDWYGQLSRREQVLVATAVLLVPLVLLAQLLVVPALQRQRLLQGQLTQLRAANGEIRQQLAAIEAQLGQDPDAASRAELQRLQRQLQQIDSRFDGQLAGLVEPAQMPALVRQLLAQRPDLHLRQLVTRPVAPLQLPAAPAEGSQELLYRHPLQLQMCGDYLALLAYVRQLEALPQQVLIEQVRFVREIAAAPDATQPACPAGALQAELQLVTLSLTPEWLLLAAPAMEERP